MQDHHNLELKNELIGLEKRYWKAMQTHDLEAALALTDFPCLVAGPQGSSLVNQEQFKKMFASHSDMEMSSEFKNEPQIRMISDDIAVIAYEVSSQIKTHGESSSMEAVDTSTWIRRNGNWTCVLHTETPLTKH